MSVDEKFGTLSYMSDHEKLIVFSACLDIRINFLLFSYDKRLVPFSRSGDKGIEKCLCFIRGPDLVNFFCFGSLKRVLPYRTKFRRKFRKSGVLPKNFVHRNIKKKAIEFFSTDKTAEISS